MRGFFFWEGDTELRLGLRSNQYGALLARSLVRHDVELHTGDYTFDADHLQRSRAGYDVLHLNWLDRFYARPSGPESLRAYTRFAETLVAARRWGYRVIWSVHNLFPHERAHPELDSLVNLLVAREADEVIAHCRHGAEEITRRYGRDRVHVVPHGNFLDVFPDTVTRAAARAHLGIDTDSFVFVFFGNLRGYKGVERLIDAFRDAGDDDAVLLLMMKTNSRAPGLFDAIRQRVVSDPAIVVTTSDFFEVEEFQYYLNAADVGVLPFATVMTSGTAIQALGFGLPLVVPDLGCMSELIDPSMGVLYDDANPDGLADAMLRTRSMDLAAASQAARARARELDWAPIGQKVAALYRGA